MDRFWNFKPLAGYDESQVGIPGVNMVEPKAPEAPKIQQVPKGMDAVRFKDDPNAVLDLNSDNFRNIYRKQSRGEKLGLAEQNFLSDLKYKTQFEGKSMQEVLGVETKVDKEAKYKNLAMENRNLSSGDLRNNLASSGLNYDEIEKVIWYHQPYNEYLQTKNELKSRSEEAFARKKELIDKQLAETSHQIQENWKNRMNTLNTGLSFTGFGRSSEAISRRDDVTRSVNAEMSIAQAKAQAELQLYQAQLQGADAETLGALSQNLASYTNALKNQQTENALLAQKLNDEANVSMKAALDNMIALSWVNENEIDKELSKELGFLVNKKGAAVNLGEDGKPIYLLSGRKQNYDEFKDNRDYNYNVYKDDKDFGLKERKFAHDVSVDNSKLSIDSARLDLDRDKFNFEMVKDDIKQEKQDRQDLQNALYAAEDAKTMIDEFESLKDNWMGSRQMPSVAAKIERLRTSLAFMEVQNLKAKGVSMNPMTDNDFNNIKDSVSSLSALMTQDEFNKEIERIQWVIQKWVDRRVWKYNYKYDFDTMEILPLDKAKGSPSSKKNFSDKEASDFLDWNTEKLSYNKTKKDFSNFPKADQTAINKGLMNKALASTRTSWQCGAFVNDYVENLTWKRIMWDSYESKKKHINSDMPLSGSLAVWNPGGKYAKNGHTWIVLSVDWATVTIKDANWKWDGKVMVRKVPISSILNKDWWFVNFS